jgi:hypothetical protein
VLAPAAAAAAEEDTVVAAPAGVEDTAYLRAAVYAAVRAWCCSGSRGLWDHAAAGGTPRGCPAAASVGAVQQLPQHCSEAAVGRTSRRRREFQGHHRHALSRKELHLQSPAVDDAEGALEEQQGGGERRCWGLDR